jgi:hypothetical protein
MLQRIRSRLSYANVMATGALFVALGGGAYALSGVPDRSGVFQGCVDPKTGALRVVKSASSCRKTRTVRRGSRRIRIPGESAIAWNQQGPRGFQGGQGGQGLRGLQGLQGLQGVQGVQGGPGLSGYQLVSGTSTPRDTTQLKFPSVSCPAGKKMIALGVSGFDVSGTLPAIIPAFDSNGTSGMIWAQKYDGLAYSITPAGVCANVQG